MASFCYFSMIEDLARGAIDFDTDTFYCLIVTSSYTPSQSHAKRSDVNANEVSGTGYTAGGQACSVSLSRTNGVLSITPANVTWTSPVNGFTGRRAVIYKRRGGAASADELVCCIDPGASVAANGTSYTVQINSALTLTVPTGT
jgi:hypothetical protein